MGFVNESIAGKGLEQFLSYGFTSPVTGKPIPPYKWTIDRDRDVFLLSLGGQGGRLPSDIPLFLVLVWKGQVIRIEGNNWGKGDFFKDAETWWKITRLSIPKALEPESETVIALLKEALTERGMIHERDAVKAVHIDLAVQPRFV